MTRAFAAFDVPVDVPVVNKVAVRTVAHVFSQRTHQVALPVSSLVCDVSYEGFDATEWRSDAADIEGITVAAVARIERQRAHKRTSR